jgi:hypothetical protein
VEIAGGLGIYFFGATGRVYGLLAGIRGRAYVVGLCRRGIFYRFGATIYSPSPGRFDSSFGLRTQVGAINLMVKKWIRDEILLVRFRRNWIRGNINISRTGLYSFQLYATDPDLVAEIDRRNCEISSEDEIEDASYYQSNYKE